MDPYTSKVWISEIFIFSEKANKNGQRNTLSRIQKQKKIQNAYRIHHIEASALRVNYDIDCTKYTTMNHKWNLRDSGSVRHTTLENKKKNKKKKKQSIKDQFLFFVQNSEWCRMCVCAWTPCMSCVSECLQILSSVFLVRNIIRYISFFAHFCWHFFFCRHVSLHPTRNHISELKIRKMFKDDERRREKKTTREPKSNNENKRREEEKNSNGNKCPECQIHTKLKWMKPIGWIKWKMNVHSMRLWMLLYEQVWDCKPCVRFHTIENCLLYGGNWQHLLAPFEIRKKYVFCIWQVLLVLLLRN